MTTGFSSNKLRESMRMQTYRTDAAWPVLSTPVDSYFANVSSLLHFDDASVSAITDKIPRVWTPHGSGISISTTNKRFGSGSLDVVGGGDYYIDTPSTTDIQLGGGVDFTIEAWVRPTSLSSVWNLICQKDFVSGSSYWSYAFALYNGKVRIFTGDGNSTAPPQALDGATNATLNSFNHVACQRRGGNYEVYLNGTLDGSAAVSTAVGTATKPLRVGSFADGGNSSFAGQIDDFRITKGVARYAGSFAIPTAAFPDSA